MAKQYFLFDDQNFMVKRLLDQNASGLPYAQRNSLYANQSKFFALGLSPILKTIPKNGLFSSVALYKTDCQTAKDEDVFKICFLYIDFDFKEKDNQEALSFKQMRKDGHDAALVEKYQAEISIIQDVLSGFLGQLPFNLSLSGGGFHVHYLLDEAQGWTLKGLKHLEELGSDILAKQGLKIDEIKDQVINLDAWAGLYKEIVSKLNAALKNSALEADGVNFSPSRLLRDLGFNHLKDPSSPMLIRRIDDVSPFKADIKPLAPIKLNDLLAKHHPPRLPTNPSTHQPTSTPPKDNQVHPLQPPTQSNAREEMSDNDGYYNFKPSQRIYIYGKADQSQLLSFDTLLKRIRSAAHRADLINAGFIISNESDKGVAYNIQASLFEGDFKYQGKPADVGSIFLTIKPKFELKNDVFKFATIEARIRNQVNSRYLESLEGCHWGVFPPRYYVDTSEPLALSESIIDLIENKLDKQLYLYRQELCLIDLSSQHPFQVIDLDDLKLELTKAKWIGAKEKEINFETNSSFLKLAYRALIKYQKLREIKSISSLPMLDEDFQIKAVKGYDQPTKTFIASSSNLDGFRVDLSISQNEMVSKVRDEMAYIYSCFRFPTKTREHFIQILAALLQLFLSSRIRSKPFISIVANDQGRGKTLLAKALSTFITGIKPNIIAYEKNQQTMKDEIIANLNRSSTDSTNDISFIIDNIDSSFGNGFLNSMLTAGESIKMRPKYAASIIEVKIPFSFIGTGNNVRYNADLGRRIFQISLDSSGMGLSSEDYIYEGRAEGNKGRKRALKDDAYLDFLASEHEEAIKSLIKILAYTNAIKPIYSDEINGLKRMASFSDFDCVLETCFIVGKCLGFVNCDVAKLNELDMSGQKNDVEENHLFISTLRTMMVEKIEDFAVMHIREKIKSIVAKSTNLEDSEYKWMSEEEEQNLANTMDDLQILKIINQKHAYNEERLEYLLRNCRGKISNDGFKLEQQVKRSKGKTWYSITKAKETKRASLFDDALGIKQVNQPNHQPTTNPLPTHYQPNYQPTTNPLPTTNPTNPIEQVLSIEETPILSRPEFDNLKTKTNTRLKELGLEMDFLFIDSLPNPSIQITEGQSKTELSYRILLSRINNNLEADQTIKKVIQALYQEDEGKRYLRRA
jgi:hypothetical protein